MSCFNDVRQLLHCRNTAAALQCWNDHQRVFPESLTHFFVNLFGRRKNVSRSTMVIRPLDDRTIVHGITSQPANVFQNVLYRNFVYLQPFWLQFESRTFWPLAPIWASVGQGWAYLIAYPYVPISSPSTHKVHLLPFSNYLAGSKSVSTIQPRYDDNCHGRSYW